MTHVGRFRKILYDVSVMKLSLFVFIDAYGWELFKRYKILEDRLQYEGPLETVFGYSSACDPTILTGLQPEEHGHFSFFYFHKDGSPLSPYTPLKFMPRVLSRSGRVRNLVSRFVKKQLGYTGYFQLYNVPFQHLDILGYSEKRDLYEPNGINSGAPTFFDHLRAERIPFHCSNWRNSEETNIAELSADLQQGRVRCAYLYLAEMDGLLHHHGTGSDSVKKKLQWYDRQLRSVLALAEQKYDEVDLHLFSDHGMTEVRETCRLMDLVEDTSLEFGVDYVACYDSTMARFWFLTEGSRERIEAALAEERRGHWLAPEELEQLGCRFPNEKYGEAFFLLDPGVLLCPSFMGEKPVAGMHGYHPKDKDSLALFASTKPLSQSPKKLSDLCEFMKREVA